MEIYDFELVKKINEYKNIKDITKIYDLIIDLLS